MLHGDATRGGEASAREEAACVCTYCMCVCVWVVSTLVGMLGMFPQTCCSSCAAFQEKEHIYEAAEATVSKQAVRVEGWRCGGVEGCRAGPALKRLPNVRLLLLATVSAAVSVCWRSEVGLKQQQVEFSSHVTVSHACARVTACCQSGRQSEL